MRYWAERFGEERCIAARRSPLSSVNFSTLSLGSIARVTGSGMRVLRLGLDVACGGIQMRRNTRIPAHLAVRGWSSLDIRVHSVRFRRVRMIPALISCGMGENMRNGCFDSQARRDMGIPLEGMGYAGVDTHEGYLRIEESPWEPRNIRSPA